MALKPIRIDQNRSKAKKIKHKITMCCFCVQFEPQPKQAGIQANFSWQCLVKILMCSVLLHRAWRGARI